VTGSGAPDDDEAVHLALDVNGRARTLRVKSRHTLLQVLRDDLHLAGVREACGVGMCGACTVLLDGRPVSACLLLAPLAHGKHVVTIESEDARLHVIQQAYIDHTAFQCSFCTPGFVLMTHALLTENPNPTSDEIRDYLAGNLCRCGSYVKIEAAVLDAAQRLSEA
jgi:aerobic-type carbon monoxide dehydrogenase small subunit (CoxS/CutS family)